MTTDADVVLLAADTLLRILTLETVKMVPWVVLFVTVAWLHSRWSR